MSLQSYTTAPAMNTVSEIYAQKTAAGEVTADEAQAQAAQRLDRLASDLSAPQARPRRGILARLKGKTQAQVVRGVYLHGGVGRGKSMLMDMFFTAVPIAQKRRVHFHAFMLEVHDFLHARRQERAGGKASSRIDADIIACADAIAQKSRLLCFDEFQVRDVADAMILGRLFTALFARGVAVVMTSNVAPDDLYKDGLQRDRFLPFIALLKERMDVLHFGGDVDYRLLRLRDLKVYFWPHDADAKQSLDRIFTTVSDGAPGEAAKIEVKSRIIDIPRAHREVAAFTFEELCGTAKSALDYLEIVKRYKLILVENVPVLGDERRDAALRFVTLVDTVYDHHAQLVVSAAAPPEKIYRGEEHAFVFERTISRLLEMQSRAYRGG